MVHELNSLDRYREGKKISKKYTLYYIWSCVGMLVFGFGSFIAFEKCGIPGLWSIAVMMILFFPTFKMSVKATKGDMMMRSAVKTWGSDEEEY